MCEAASNSELSFICSACHLQSLPFLDGLQDDSYTELDHRNHQISDNLLTDDTLKSSKGISICLLNINSLISKIDEIKLLVLNNNIDILCLNETKIDQEIGNSEIHIDGYNIYRKDRNRHGGGVAIYSKESLNTKILHRHLNPDIESLWLELKPFKSSPIIIACIYRPPAHGQDREIVENICHHIKQYSKTFPKNSEIFILGDLNVNMKKNTVLSSKIKELCHSLNMEQLINEDTRITESSSSLIDLILSNSHHIDKSGVLHTGISDHSLIWTTRKVNKYKSAARTIKTRSFKNFDPARFEYDLSIQDWNFLNNIVDIDQACVHFTETLIKVLDKHAPI